MRALLVLWLQDELERLQAFAHGDLRVQSEGDTRNHELVGVAQALFEIVAARAALDAAEFARARAWIASAGAFVTDLAGRGGTEGERAVTLTSLAVADALLAIDRAADSIASIHARRSSVPPARATSSVLLVGHGGSSFSIDGGPVVNLRRRPILMRLLSALAQARRTRPGEYLPIQEVVAAAWPGERMMPRSARNRLYFAVHALRRLGLREAISSRDGGYCIPSHIDVRFEDDASPELC